MELIFAQDCDTMSLASAVANRTFAPVLLSFWFLFLVFLFLFLFSGSLVRLMKKAKFSLSLYSLRIFCVK